MSFTSDDEQTGEKALGDGVSNEASEDRREPATSSRRAFCKLLMVLSAVTGYELLSAGSQPLEAAPPSKAHNTDGHSSGKGKKAPSKQHLRHTDLHSDTRKQKAHGPHKDTPTKINIITISRVYIATRPPRRAKGVTFRIKIATQSRIPTSSIRI